MLESDRDLFATAQAAHKLIYERILHLSAMTRGESQLTVLVDRIYVLREAATLIEDTRKELNKLKELCEKITCARWAQANEAEPIRTEYCTGSPEIKLSPQLPTKKNNPEEYLQLMQYMGIPDTLFAGESEMVRPHWPGMLEHVTKLAQEGLPLPPGVNPAKTFPVYSVTVRGKKGILSGREPVVDDRF